MVLKKCVHSRQMHGSHNMSKLPITYTYPSYGKSHQSLPMYGDVITHIARDELCIIDALVQSILLQLYLTGLGHRRRINWRKSKAERERYW